MFQELSLQEMYAIDGGKKVSAATVAKKAARYLGVAVGFVWANWWALQPILIWFGL